MSVYYQPTLCEECSNGSCGQRGKRTHWPQGSDCSSYQGERLVEEEEEITKEYEVPDFGNIFPPNWVFNPLYKVLCKLKKRFIK